jgi:hypothetical protein
MLQESKAKKQPASFLTKVRMTRTERLRTERVARLMKSRKAALVAQKAISDVEGSVVQKVDDTKRPHQELPNYLRRNETNYLTVGVTLAELKTLTDHNVLLASAFDTILRTTRDIDVNQLVKNMTKVKKFR